MYVTGREGGWISYSLFENIDGYIGWNGKCVQWGEASWVRLCVCQLYCECTMDECVWAEEKAVGSYFMSNRKNDGNKWWEESVLRKEKRLNQLSFWKTTEGNRRSGESVSSLENHFFLKKKKWQKQTIKRMCVKREEYSDIKFFSEKKKKLQKETIKRKCVRREGSDRQFFSWKHNEGNTQSSVSVSSEEKDMGFSFFFWKINEGKRRSGKSVSSVEKDTRFSFFSEKIMRETDGPEKVCQKKRI